MTDPFRAALFPSEAVPVPWEGGYNSVGEGLDILCSVGPSRQPREADNACTFMREEKSQDSESSSNLPQKPAELVFDPILFTSGLIIFLFYVVMKHFLVSALCQVLC